MQSFREQGCWAEMLSISAKAAADLSISLPRSHLLRRVAGGRSESVGCLHNNRRTCDVFRNAACIITIPLSEPVTFLLIAKSSFEICTSLPFDCFQLCPVHPFILLLVLLCPWSRTSCTLLRFTRYSAVLPHWTRLESNFEGSLLRLQPSMAAMPGWWSLMTFLTRPFGFCQRVSSSMALARQEQLCPYACGQSRPCWVRCRGRGHWHVGRCSWLARRLGPRGWRKKHWSVVAWRTRGSG